MAGLHGRAATVDLGRPRNGTHSRQPSDIDSLSPEVVSALQSTFGGKLNEVRSQPSLPKPSPLQRPPAEEREEVVDSENEGMFLAIAYVAGIVASISILITAGVKKPEENEDVSCKGIGDSRCVRLYGYILPIGVTGISLILALVLSVFDVSFGVYNVLKTTENFFVASRFKLSDVPRVLLSYIIDIGFVAIAIELLWLARASTVDPLFTLCEEVVKVFWTFGLITMGTVIFWCAAKSIRNPTATHLYMRRAAKIVIILILFCAASSMLYNVVAPPRPSRPCQVPEDSEVKNSTDDTQLQLYYKGWLYEIPDPQSKLVQLFSEAHQFDWWCPSDSQKCPVRKKLLLPQCKPRAKPDFCEAKDDEFGMCKARYDQETCAARYDDDHGMCEARYDRGTCEARYGQGMCEARYDRGTCEARYDEGMCEARYDRGTCEARYDEGMCEARYEQGTCKARTHQGECPPRWRNEVCEAIEWQECEWPWLKRIQEYERKDKCKYDLPVCDWSLVKRIEIYESKKMCKYHCPSCDWPLVKRIQAYSRGDRCGTLTLPGCDWPYLKQLQPYQAREGRCHRNDRPQCEWPFLKQIQSYKLWHSFSTIHHQGCDLPGEGEEEESHERRDESLSRSA